MASIIPIKTGKTWTETFADINANFNALNSGGGTIGNNVLKADVTFTSTETNPNYGVTYLDYALNLEIGKLYQLNWTFNGVSYSQTTYCWSSNGFIWLGTPDPSDGGEIILISHDNIDDDEGEVMVVIEKTDASPPAEEEDFPSEAKAVIMVTTPNYANLIIQSIKEVGTYIPPIPIPTYENTNKVLQVQGTKYTLVDLPRDLYRHDVRITVWDGNNLLASVQCVILDRSSAPCTYAYNTLFSLIQKMQVITAVGTVVVERSDGKKTQGNVTGIQYNSSGDGKIVIKSTYIDSDTSMSVSDNYFEIPSDCIVHDFVTKIE